MKNTLKTIGAIVLLVVVILAFDLGSLFWYEYIEPQKEDARREVYENTQSYVHGKIQDLSKYYEEYHNTNEVDKKTTIKNVIQMQFSNFNSKHINNEKLKSFLFDMRGF